VLGGGSGRLDGFDETVSLEHLRLETSRPAARSPTGAVLARPVPEGLHHACVRTA
jgi:hypothetical protein